MRDVFRFAVGTFTAIPVQPPSKVDRSVTLPAIILAPLAVLPLGILTAFVLWAGRELELAPIATAALAVGALALGSRAFHLDGLSDTADALTCSYDVERSLEVMKRGDAGPAGASALVIVLGIQIGAMTSLLGSDWGPVLVGLLVCAARGVAVILSLRGVPAASSSGLAASYADSLSPVAAIGVWSVLTVLICGAIAIDGGDWWRGLIAVAVAMLAVAWLIRRAVKRLGGVAGDVYGAAVEISLALMLLAVS